MLANDSIYIEGFRGKSKMKWILDNQAFLLGVTNILLLIITGVYVILTGKMSKFAEKQFKIISNPVIGINVTKMHISKVYGNKRRNLEVCIDVHNLGNAPAIDIQIDGQLEYENSSIDGNKKIPSYTEPRRISYLKSSDSILDSFETKLHFGNKGIIHLFDDFRENERLNRHRIENDKTLEPFPGSKLCVFIYYSNNLGQLFESYFETYICLPKETIIKENKVIIKDKSIPSEDEEIDLDFHPYIRPVFYSKLIEKRDVIKQLKERNNKRDLCGW
jgi:hypothetical protein